MEIRSFRYARLEMKPISFELKKTILKSSRDICSEIADTSNWSDFGGYGFLPGIEKAEYEKQGEPMVGSRIHVLNTDGSKHVEEVLEWNPDTKIVMKLHEFSAPLSGISTHFIEEWNFEKVGKKETLVVRKFQLFSRSFVSHLFLWMISFLFIKAIKRHFDQIAERADIA